MLAFNIHSFVVASLLLLVVEASFSYKSPYPPDEVDKLAAKGLAKLAKYRAIHHPYSKCTIANAIKRREWQVFSYPLLKLLSYGPTNLLEQV
jgi:hypothetical protein